MRLRNCFILLFVYLSVSQHLFADEKVLRGIFPDIDDIRKKTVSISKNDKKRISVLSGKKNIPDIFTYYEVRPLGYAVIKNAKGRYKDFTFMVVVNSKGSIEMVKILKYDELFGRKIKDERFLSRFKEKTLNSPLKINVDIDAMTGATISCKALTEGVKKALTYLSVVVLEQ